MTDGVRSRRCPLGRGECSSSDASANRASALEDDDSIRMSSAVSMTSGSAATEVELRTLELRLSSGDALKTVSGRSSSRCAIGTEEGRAVSSRRGPSHLAAARAEILVAYASASKGGCWHVFTAAFVLASFIRLMSFVRASISVRKSAVPYISRRGGHEALLWSAAPIK